MKSKVIFFLLFSVTCLLQTTAVWADIGISPDHSPQGSAACPAPVSNEYHILNVPPGCSINITLESGDVVEFIPDNANKKFTAKWVDIPQIVKVKVAPVQSGCFATKEFDIVVLSVNGLAPQITSPETGGCPGALVIGKAESFEMTAELLYQYKGLNDPAEVGEYQWEIYSGGTGWVLNSISQGGVVNKKALILADISHDATIRVRGKSRCGNR
jgi:hypothetical protein